MTARNPSTGRDILHWSGIFVCLGVIFFFVVDFAAMGLEDAGLSGNRLVQVLVFALIWPLWVLESAFGWSLYSDSNLLGPFLVQVLGWSFLGIPVGLWRAEQRSSRADSAI